MDINFARSPQILYTETLQLKNEKDALEVDRKIAKMSPGNLNNIQIGLR